MWDRRSSVNMYHSLCIKNVAEVVRRGRLRWFGHRQRWVRIMNIRTYIAKKNIPLASSQKLSQKQIFLFQIINVCSGDILTQVHQISCENNFLFKSYIKVSATSCKDATVQRH